MLPAVPLDQYTLAPKVTWAESQDATPGLSAADARAASGWNHLRASATAAAASTTSLGGLSLAAWAALAAFCSAEMPRSMAAFRAASWAVVRSDRPICMLKVACPAMGMPPSPLL